MMPMLNRFSLTGIHVETLVPLMATLSGAVFLVVWHIYTAYKHNSLAGFMAYFVSRLILCVFYGMYIVIKLTDGDDLNLHLHHYAVGFLAASLAEFNHPISVLTLALGTA